jgi:hypothetical protein
MDDWVRLSMRRNRGWPWPDDSWGLSPMFGDDGWCRSCGMPLREQRGSLVLRTKGLANVSGAWVPNWRFDAICLDGALAQAVADRFAVALSPVEWRGAAPIDGAAQIVVSSTAESWFDPDELSRVTRARHGVTGRRCDECDRWRWMPVAAAALPRPRVDAVTDDQDVVASPEWFGDGWNSFREIAFRRSLAEVIAGAAPKDLAIAEFA